MAADLIPFDTFTLAAAASELNRTLPGARVQKLRQMSTAEVGLTLHGSTGGTRHLLLSIDPRAYRVHFTQIKREPLAVAPAFLQVSRKWLDGAYFEAATLPFWDRILRLRFRSPEGETVFLIAELMGRNSNLILTTGSGATETIRGALRFSAAHPASGRLLSHGALYADPPGVGERTDPRTLAADAPIPIMPDESLTWLITNLSGVSRFAAGEVIARAAYDGKGYASALRAMLSDVEAGHFEPHQIGDASGSTIGVWPFAPRSVPSGLRFRRESISVALDTLYAALNERTVSQRLHVTLEKAIAKETSFRERELASARRTLAEGERSDEYGQWGNLILAQLDTIPDGGATSVSLVDLYAEHEGVSITIPLDPGKTARENADALFARARKLRDAMEYADGQAADREDELQRLAALAERLAANPSHDELIALREDLGDLVGVDRISPTGAPRADKPTAKPFGGFRIRTYELDGWTLLVGESAEANDHLLTRISAPQDLWMHVRAGTGAHGVLRTNKEPTRVPDKVIRRAAAIVAAKSQSVKHSGVVAVDITERRYVRKPRGAKAGLAQYERARTIDVTPALP